ncbi:MAG: DUF2299 family protein [Acidobacteria bacterium]|nr:DUF2299 family protein [Acidobacteriota bacterium]
MSTESWMFLFGALGGVGGVVQLAQFGYQLFKDRREVGMATSETHPSSFSISVSRYLVLVCLFVVSMGLSIFGFYRSMTRAQSAEPATVSNVESRIGEWLDAFHLGRRKLQPTDDAIFHIEITMHNNARVEVLRTKDLEKYIILRRIVAVGDSHRKIWAAISEKERTRIALETLNEVSRLKMGYAMQWPTLFSVNKRLPITSSLTESSFIEALDEVEAASEIARRTFAFSMEEYNESGKLVGKENAR